MDYIKLFEDFKTDRDEKRNKLHKKYNDLLDKFIVKLEKKYNVDLWFNYSKYAKCILLSKIVVDKEDRSKGIGTIIMGALCDFADKYNLPIGLTPTNDFGGSVARLKRFYKQFGFKPYKGYKMREKLIREPKINENFSQEEYNEWYEKKDI